MASPFDNLLNPTREQLYDDLQLDYFFEKTKAAYPISLSENEQYAIIIKVMAWAVARSYQQPRILKYLYNPVLVLDELLPRLADTLSFTYPLEYPLDQLRVLIQYLQKIRRTRGTFDSIRRLLRLLETTEADVLALTFYDYSSVEIEEVSAGFLYIRYNKIQDFDFANSMLRLVVPAGYTWRLESSVDTAGLRRVIRVRVDTFSCSEKFKFEGDTYWGDEGTAAVERVTVDKYNQQS